jgi:uncharacterized coiled-coil protein SlyX
MEFDEALKLAETISQINDRLARLETRIGSMDDTIVEIRRALYTENGGSHSIVTRMGKLEDRVKEIEGDLDQNNKLRLDVWKAALIALVSGAVSQLMGILFR